MDNRIVLLIELKLFNTISGLHDLTDKTQREKAIKDCILDFSKEHGIDPIDVIDLLKKLFDKQRETYPTRYPNFKGNSLHQMILGYKSDSKKTDYDSISKD